MSPDNTPAFQERHRGVTPKTLITIVAAALCALFAPVSVTHAAPGPGSARDRFICDVQAQARALRKLLRHPKSYGGPLATRPSRGKLAIGLDLADHLQRAKKTTIGNEAAAIQNDAPAARVGGDDQAPPALEPLGVLSGSVDSHPLTHACSPRSPRGPPAVV